MNLKIRVERIAFDTDECTLRLTGKNMEENEHVKMGQYHTINIGIGQPFTIEKDCWDAIYLQRLEDATDVTKKAEIAAIVMQEGLAYVCLVTKSMTLTRSKIETSFPKKSQFASATGTDKSKSRFFAAIFDAVKKHVNFDVVKVVLVGSPGFLRDEFMRYYEEQCVKLNETILMKNRNKFLKAHTSCGYKHAIDEMLGDQNLRGPLGDVAAAGEVNALQEFHATLNRDQDRACYGYKSVAYADEQLAIETLLVTDKLFKATDVNVRKKYVDLVERVRGNGGSVYIFSSMHVSGQQLDMYTGIAATLRYPLAEPEEDESIAAAETSDVKSAEEKGAVAHTGADIRSDTAGSLDIDENNLAINAVFQFMLAL
jgi:protein pelota